MEDSLKKLWQGVKDHIGDLPTTLAEIKLNFFYTRIKIPHVDELTECVPTGRRVEAGNIFFKRERVTYVHDRGDGKLTVTFIAPFKEKVVRLSPADHRVKTVSIDEIEEKEGGELPTGDQVIEEADVLSNPDAEKKEEQDTNPESDISGQEGEAG